LGYFGHPVPVLVAVAATILVVALAVWVLMIIWTKGGPQPVHEIVIAIPAPHTASHFVSSSNSTPTSGRRA
jgi:hypothetical protein